MRSFSFFLPETHAASACTVILHTQHESRLYQHLMKDLIWNNLLRLLRDKVGFKERKTARYLSSYTLKMNNLRELLQPHVIAIV